MFISMRAAATLVNHGLSGVVYSAYAVGLSWTRAALRDINLVRIVVVALHGGRRSSHCTSTSSFSTDVSVNTR
jgi:hypothetical protein